ncbi:hypothetical protein B0H34DRAFT_859440 [Crassisporium funariophilum]|nr:hypothetical protein B0H34DRAFT_859440 [Crassisporium funariophilum]
MAGQSGRQVGEVRSVNYNCWILWTGTAQVAYEGSTTTAECRTPPRLCHCSSRLRILADLTPTLPRTRKVLSMDRDSERLMTPSENIYGSTPSNSRFEPHTFDTYAAYRFSLALQVVVNIGVRGSEREPRGQGGTLNVVRCILEACLANKRLAVGPSSSTTGMPRETGEHGQ